LNGLAVKGFSNMLWDEYDLRKPLEKSRNYHGG